MSLYMLYLRSKVWKSTRGRYIVVNIYCSIFSQLLCNDKIATSRKLPFCLYLVWVYLDADLMATHTHNTLSLM